MDKMRLVVRAMLTTRETLLKRQTCFEHTFTEILYIFLLQM
jgi:hypothetical protein